MPFLMPVLWNTNYSLANVIISSYHLSSSYHWYPSYPTSLIYHWSPLLSPASEIPQFSGLSAPTPRGGRHDATRNDGGCAGRNDAAQGAGISSASGGEKWHLHCIAWSWCCYMFWLYLMEYCYILLYIVIYCYILLYIVLYCYILLYIVIYCFTLFYIVIYCYILFYIVLYCYISYNIYIYTYLYPYGGFLKGWYPKNGWFIMDNLVEMDDFGVPLFRTWPYVLVVSNGILLYVVIYCYRVLLCKNLWLPCIYLSLLNVVRLQSWWWWFILLCLLGPKLA